jgi:hypothetical protein
MHRLHVQVWTTPLVGQPARITADFDAVVEGEQVQACTIQKTGRFALVPRGMRPAEPLADDSPVFKSFQVKVSLPGNPPELAMIQRLTERWYVPHKMGKTGVSYDIYLREDKGWLKLLTLMPPSGLYE